MDGVLELDRSVRGALERAPFCGVVDGLAVTAVCVCFTTAAVADADDDDDFAGISLMSLASIPISCICLARFSAWLMNCIGADSASTRSNSKTNKEPVTK